VPKSCFSCFIHPAGACPFDESGRLYQNYQGGEPLIVVGPEHAATIANDGLSKQEVKQFLFQKARIPYSAFSNKHQDDRFPGFKKGDLIPVVLSEDHIIVIVSGGAGKHSMFIPTFSMSLSVTRLIR